MGTPVTRADPRVIARLLDRKLRRRILAGDEQALLELALRAIEARLRGDLDGGLYNATLDGIVGMRPILRGTSQEARVKRLEAIVEAKRGQRKAGTWLRDVGPPPDDLNEGAPRAGEPETPSNH